MVCVFLFLGIDRYKKFKEKIVKWSYSWLKNFDGLFKYWFLTKTAEVVAQFAFVLMRQDYPTLHILKYINIMNTKNTFSILS